MSGPASRIRSIFSHLLPLPPPPPHIHHLSPTLFLERAAAIEPNADAILHVTAAGAAVRRSYGDFAARAVGLAYFLKKHGLGRVGILAPNTPAFLEAIYGIAAAAAVTVPANYRLKQDDIAYIFDFAEVDCIIVDAEFEHLLAAYVASHPRTRLIVDVDTAATDGPGCGAFNEAIAEGQALDRERGARGWAGLHAQARNEDDMLAVPFTSGTTSRPKGVVFTHRGAYLAAMANIIESSLNVGRCKYLWTLPM